MRVSRIIVLGLVLAAVSSLAHAQTPGLATVVATCGAPPNTYTAGTNRPVTQNTSGQQCDATTATISGTVSENLAQVNGQTVNVGAGAAGTGTQRVTTSTDSTIGVTSTVNAVGITPTDRTITSATGASQTVMSALATRHGLIIQNTGNANCGINPTGGVAAIGGAGTLTLVPNGSYQPRIPTLTAVTAICTAAQPLYAEEN